jgi:hypothetical protein
VQDNDDSEAFYNGMLRNPGNLAVISSLHPFWHTKKGKAVIGLVVLTVIGAIVGGAIGGVRSHWHSNMRRRITVSNSSPAMASAVATTVTSLSCGCPPSLIV